MKAPAAVVVWDLRKKSRVPEISKTDGLCQTARPNFNYWRQRMKEMILILAYWLHICATVIWIGGIFFILFVTIPSTSLISPEDKKAIMGDTAKRFTSFANISIVIIVLSGIVLNILNNKYAGLGNFYNTWSIILTVKLLVVLLMILVHLYRLFILPGKIENAPTPEKKTSIQKWSLNLVKLNFFWGLVVLFLSGFASVL